MAITSSMSMLSLSIVIFLSPARVLIPGKTVLAKE
jgi:hypothetical protein